MKSKIQKVAAMLSVCLGLLACKEYEIKNGRVPKDLLPLVQKIEGTYTGRIYEETSTAGRKANERSTRLSLTLRDEVLEVTLADDPIGLNCNSRMGDLTKMIVSDDEKSLALTFDFSSPDCQSKVKGRSMTLAVKIGDWTIQAGYEILKKRVMRGGPRHRHSKRLNYEGEFLKDSV